MCGERWGGGRRWAYSADKTFDGSAWFFPTREKHVVNTAVSSGAGRTRAWLPT